MACEAVSQRVKGFASEPPFGCLDLTGVTHGSFHDADKLAGEPASAFDWRFGQRGTKMAASIIVRGNFEQLRLQIRVNRHDDPSACFVLRVTNLSFVQSHAIP